MAANNNTHLLLKILLLGGVLAALVYLFHPDVGQFNLLINGQPVAEPLFRLAAIPAVLLVMLFVGILSVLAMLGVGMLMFMGVLGFALLGVLVIAPYFWPVLLLFLVLILILSPSGR
ncbi:hypothetical protein [Methylomonas methanica]|uniref:Uncharacterized protein n=1 Tax=Methylomonas methanica (strain DSM 25384 / MC09) TaxID=857087 RepID=G0A5Y3_METMM|nr:hypothetical protein [Methylomonas methanica]AEF99260.1 hypothetical protein Metme_0821 [Methylomonas methanica MC09]